MSTRWRSLRCVADALPGRMRLCVWNYCEFVFTRRAVSIRLEAVSPVVSLTSGFVASAERLKLITDEQRALYCDIMLNRQYKI